MQHFSHVMPKEATSLLGGSLQRARRTPVDRGRGHFGRRRARPLVADGAMTMYMTALGLALRAHRSRSFLGKRMLALELVAFAFLLGAELSAEAERIRTQR